MTLKEKFKGWKRHKLPRVQKYQKTYRDAHKEKIKECNRKYYATHKTKYLIYNTLKRASRLKLVNELKNKPCADCQGWFEPCQMDFDHRDPKNKVADIAWLKYKSSIKQLLIEVSKCDVVCSNCHRLRTHKKL